MRVLGVDPGTVRVGLALSDSEARIASPLCTLEPKGSEDAVRLVVDAVREHDVQCVVVGLPIRLDGGESSASRRARRFAERVHERSGVRVVSWDERLTTAAAERSLREAGIDGRRGRRVVDRVAAALLLQSYLDAQAEEGCPGADGADSDVELR